jgi:hypothetical protein
MGSSEGECFGTKGRAIACCKIKSRLKGWIDSEVDTI